MFSAFATAKNTTKVIGKKMNKKRPEVNSMSFPLGRFARPNGYATMLVIPAVFAHQISKWL
ncbi:hypothetical protein [Sphingobium sp. SCG-1]|uniref:hypothetical protein n=1 Tax=Sphingobium sp. SCG-1 TaxID=2072936 RepID=UPI00166FADEF|nr:hypothetical protein [Sphingobium sp. SCG-1]